MVAGIRGDGEGLATTIVNRHGTGRRYRAIGTSSSSNSVGIDGEAGGYGMVWW